MRYDLAVLFEHPEWQKPLWAALDRRRVRYTALDLKQAAFDPDHSLGRSISQQIVEVANELGGATRLIAAAPFWDKGAAIDGLSSGLVGLRLLG